MIYSRARKMGFDMDITRRRKYLKSQWGRRTCILVINSARTLVHRHLQILVLVVPPRRIFLRAFRSGRYGSRRAPDQTAASTPFSGPEIILERTSPHGGIRISSYRVT